ncbi:MAG: arginine--tRNA ligase [Candidatus Chisholmbacteria bacterium]|nr:arginine--tRNA ligase [Candidatus Chisholmbacteria bacterium]
MLREQIEKVLKELGFPKVDFSLERPAEEEHGDYSSNVAMQLFSKFQITNAKLQTNFKSQISKYSNPRQLAEKITEKLQAKSPTSPAGRYQLKAIASIEVAGPGRKKNIINHKSYIKYVDRIEVAGPGFINFFFKPEYFTLELERILEEKEDFGKGKALSGQKFVVEYTDPNPFKEFHIGHLYSNIVGESLCRLFEANGAIVWRADFFGDVGMHTAKALYGLWRKFQIPLRQSSGQANAKFQIDWRKFRDLEKKSLAERVKVLGQAYTLGSQAYEDEPKAAREMKKLNLLAFVASQEYWQKEKGWKPRVDYRSHIGKIDEEELAEVRELWVKGRTWSLDYFEEIYARLGTKFDGYYPESLTGEWGYQVVMDGLKKGVFTRSDGAVVYKGEKKGLHTRVFINKLGLPTYETKDIGNPLMKYNDFKYDKSLIVTGNEIDAYFKVVIAAMKEVEPELGEKTEHLGHGMVKLKEGKMSSRTGKILSGEWLLDEAKKRVTEILSNLDTKLTKKERDHVAEIVGMGAVKYALLRGNIGRDVAFDFKESVSFEGNSGPYVQYAYARAKSVLRRANNQFSSSKDQSSSNDSNSKQFENSKIENSLKIRKLKIENFDLNREELQVLRYLDRFPEVVEIAALEYAPNTVCSYLYELAGRFNTFYNKHSILGRAEEGKQGKQGKQGEQGEEGSVTSINQLPQSTRALRQAQDLVAFRLALTVGVAQVLKTGLGLLGIAAPEKM